MLFRSIVEGINLHRKKVVGVIEYNDNRTCYDLVGQSFRTYLWDLKEEINVVGNIYENPELK